MARSSKSGVGRLLTSMRKLVSEVNDQEICRRLEILMNSEKEDLPLAMAKKLIESPGGFDPRQVPEPYSQYVKHYLYMVKRAEREQERGEPTARGKKRTRQKSTQAATTRTTQMSTSH